MGGIMPPDHEINGERLRATRLAQSRTLQQVGHDLTLSTNQILELEDGGMRCFYNRHYKLLCARRYARLLGLAVEEVLITDAPQPSAANPAHETASEEPRGETMAPAAVKKAGTTITPAAAAARRIVAGSALLAALLVIVGGAAYMKGATLPAAPVDAPMARAAMPVVDTSLPAAKQEDLAARVSPAGAVSPLASVSVAESVQPPAPALVSEPPAGPQTSSADSNAACPNTQQAAVEWQTAYPRKPGSKVYVTTTSAIVLCVSDARRRVQVAHLRTAQSRSFAGTPPFLLVATGGDLGAQEIYFQGMRVRADESAQVVKLVERAVD